MTTARPAWYAGRAVFEGMLDAIHRGARAEVWHRGVALARSGAARVVQCSPDGWVLEVAGTRVVWAWTAWRCACGEATCVHVVAAGCTLDATAKLLHRAPELVRAGPRIGHRLRSGPEGLHLRVVELVDEHGEARERPLVGDPGAGDKLLAAMPAGATELRVTSHNAARVLAGLGEAIDVEIDGRPVLVDAAPLQPQWVAWPDAGGGQRQVAVAPGITGVFADSSLVLCGDTLRRLSELGDFAVGLVLLAGLILSECLTQQLLQFAPLSDLRGLAATGIDQAAAAQAEAAPRSAWAGRHDGDRRRRRRASRARGARRIGTERGRQPDRGDR